MISRIYNFLSVISKIMFFLTSFVSGYALQARVISDLETINSQFGVPIDYQFNESSTIAGELISVPGCPKSIDGYPWVYYGDPPRCHLAGHQGPCGIDNLLYVELESPYGLCGCSCFWTRIDGKSFETSPDGRYTFCNWGVPDMVQDNKLKTCFYLQKQGPCPANQWLVKDRTGHSVTCVKQYPESKTEESLSGDVPPGVCYDNRERYSLILQKCIPGTPRGGIIFVG